MASSVPFAPLFNAQRLYSSIILMDVRRERQREETSGRRMQGSVMRSIANVNPIAPYGQESRHDHRTEEEADESERLHPAKDSDQHQQEW
jgi:hypothetical protein